MNAFDISPLYRSAIGFDRLAQMLDSRVAGDGTPSYPPYNVERISEDSYKVTMAVAGFDRAELDIEVEHDALKITGRKTRDTAQRTFLHRGIAARDFSHRFQLAEHVKVVGASLENGLLTIDLVREVPETLKPRRIVINGGPNVEVLERKSA